MSCEEFLREMTKMYGLYGWYMDIRSSSSDERTTDGKLFRVNGRRWYVDVFYQVGRDVVAYQPAPWHRVYPILPIHPAASRLVTV